ncbi:MAG: tetratricopeptide repeat protein [Terracidiphilus sp.]|jgi:tetratricopeptide (TPR) repeat protein/class 3 adenylate cyclase
MVSGSIPAEGFGNAPASTMMRKTVCVVDMVAYGRIAKILEENINAAAVSDLNQQIQGFMDRSLGLLQDRQGFCVISRPGDGIILLFHRADDAHHFGQEVHRLSNQHNAQRTEETAWRWFRIGIATGDVSTVAGTDGPDQYAGVAIATAVRLEGAARAGEIVVDAASFELLSADDRTCYGAEETVRGKRGEEFRARRFRVVAPKRRQASSWLFAPGIYAAGLGSSARHGGRNHLQFQAVALAAVLLLAVGGTIFWRDRAEARLLSNDDVLVLADFVNTTGDPVFDGTLRQGLAIQLEQSPFLKIMDDEQMQRDLRLMGLSPDVRITSEIARDICVRDAAAATIDGDIASLGRSYVFTLQAITCKGGVTLDREQIQVEDKEHVLSALGRCVTAMRAKLGESRNSIQKLDLPLEKVTTGSLEALQSYTSGLAELGRGGFLAARPMFERAIELDPNFAMAYFYLSVAYGNAGDVEREAEYARKAFTLIDRVSEYERDYIAAGYYESTGELNKAIDADRQGVANYPRAWGMQNNLSENSLTLGEFEDGLKAGQAANQLQPSVEPPYRRLLDAYMCLDRLEEAGKVAEVVRKQGIDGARIHQRLLEMAYIEGDQPAIDREIQWYAGKPEEYLSFGLQAAHLNVLGQRRESSKLYQRAAETAQRQGLGSVAAAFEEADALADAFSGDCETVHHLRRPALALAMCGSVASAENLAVETSRLYPNGIIWNTVQLPGIRAAIDLKRGQPASAVELLASASPYERAYPEAVYLRGLAYLGLRKGPEAAAEFQKILDHKGASWGSTWRYPDWGIYYSISAQGLARAFELEGDQVKARKAFQDFFALWKDADEDLPILVEAKRDYAALQMSR